MDRPLIAIVDDDRTFLTVVRESLEDEGYRAVIWRARGGAFALIKRERPALVVLDIRMEQIEADIAALQALRLDPATRGLPVIVCSTDGRYLQENEAHLREKGCATLHKPFDLDELLALVAAGIGAPAPAARA